jgi:hypothetical protein
MRPVSRFGFGFVYAQNYISVERSTQALPCEGAFRSNVIPMHQALKVLPAAVQLLIKKMP